MHPISKLLCEVYSELHKQGQVSFPLHQKQKDGIDSVVKTVNSSFFGVERYSTVADKAVAYLCYIIKNPPVTDGNKRLAIFWFKVYCVINELEPDPTPYTLDQIAVAIEKTKPEEVPMEKLIELTKQLLFKS